jgi:type II secretory ATPase GspE/PulE/Tfp pilus assembly ATPase PilB-like protein
VFEILTFDKDIEEAILRSKGEDAIWQLARKKGMLTLREDALVKCINGKIPFSEMNEL